MDGASAKPVRETNKFGGAAPDTVGDAGVPLPSPSIAVANQRACLARQALPWCCPSRIAASIVEQFRQHTAPLIACRGQQVAQSAAIPVAEKGPGGFFIPWPHEGAPNLAAQGVNCSNDSDDENHETWRAKQQAIEADLGVGERKFMIVDLAARLYGGREASSSVQSDSSSGDASSGYEPGSDEETSRDHSACPDSLSGSSSDGEVLLVERMDNDASACALTSSAADSDAPLVRLTSERFALSEEDSWQEDNAGSGSEADSADESDTDNGFFSMLAVPGGSVSADQSSLAQASNQMKAADARVAATGSASHRENAVCSVSRDEDEAESDPVPILPLLASRRPYPVASSVSDSDRDSDQDLDTPNGSASVDGTADEEIFFHGKDGKFRFCADWQACIPHAGKSLDQPDNALVLSGDWITDPDPSDLQPIVAFLERELPLWDKLVIESEWIFDLLSQVSEPCLAGISSLTLGDVGSGLVRWTELSRLMDRLPALARLDVDIQTLQFMVVRGEGRLSRIKHLVVRPERIFNHLFWGALRDCLNGNTALQTLDLTHFSEIDVIPGLIALLRHNTTLQELAINVRGSDHESNLAALVQQNRTIRRYYLHVSEGSLPALHASPPLDALRVTLTHFGMESWTKLMDLIDSTSCPKTLEIELGQGVQADWTAWGDLFLALVRNRNLQDLSISSEERNRFAFPSLVEVIEAHPALQKLRLHPQLYPAAHAHRIAQVLQRNADRAESAGETSGTHSRAASPH